MPIPIRVEKCSLMEIIRIIIVNNNYTVYTTFVTLLTRKLSLTLSAADTCNSRCECGDGPELVLANCRGAEAADCVRDSNKAPRVRLFLRDGWGQSPEGGGVLLV